MKKILALFLGFIMLFSSIGVSASTLDFLKRPYTNYSDEAEVHISFDNSEEFLSVFSNVFGEGGGDYIGRHVRLHLISLSILIIFLFILNIYFC